MSQTKQESLPGLSMKASTLSSKSNLKYVSLMLLVVQNTTVVLLMRYSRTVMVGPRYLTSTAVVITEIMKFVTCFFLVLHGNGWVLYDTLKQLKYEIVDKYRETLMVSIPSFLYTLQNNLIYISLNYLDAATFSVTYQMKIFTVAIFSVIILKKQLSFNQWIALGMLAMAVIFVQWPADNQNTSHLTVSTNMKFLGVICVLIACVLSGFSGVYFEKMLKGTSTSVWIRNIQLGLLGFVFAISEVYIKDYDAISKRGFFQGYNSVVWGVVTLQAIGGLVIAAVIKYADNILKGFATAVSIVLSSIFSYFLLQDFQPTILFAIGTVFVVCSIFLYGRKGSTPLTPPSSVTTKREEIGDSNAEKASKLVEDQFKE